MHATQAPSTTPVQQPVRIRLSCDSCSAAKVKCDKTRPSCERCSSNQLHCVYGVSRRHGCKRRTTNERVPTTHGTASTHQSPMITGTRLPSEKQGNDSVDFLPNHGNTINGKPTENNNNVFQDGSDLLDPFQFLADDGYPMSIDLEGSEFTDMSFNTSLPTPYDTPESFDLLSVQHDHGKIPWMPFATQSKSPSQGEDLVILSHNTTARSLPSSKAIDNILNQPAYSNKSSNSTASNERTKDVHDSEAYAIALLRSLHQWPLYSLENKQTASNNMAGTISESYLTNNSTHSEPIPSLDKILHANKCALTGLTRLLDRSHAQSSHLIILYMSIITKILSLYEAATVVNSSSLSYDSPGSISSESSTHDSAAPRIARTAIIQLGVFDLDEEDQANLQRGILLRELRKVERVIEKFALLGSGDANEDDVNIQQWHHTAVSMAKKELHKIIESVKRSFY